jgi:hypothetical protein
MLPDEAEPPSSPARRVGRCVLFDTMSAQSETSRREWTVFQCPHCLRRLHDDQITCGPCWRQVPEELRDAWLAATGAKEDAAACAAILHHFLRASAHVRLRRTWPAAMHGIADPVELLSYSPYRAHDPRTGQQWRCGCCERQFPAGISHGFCEECWSEVPPEVSRRGRAAATLWLLDPQPPSDL